ncbi:TIGR02285 family protein [Magnetococcus sp. PR-3]|uniref:TIGR02285 family protein n=1 Tax=Magnetococcus sp. PR-3 TaxID=3120355 RepID=UPI002FCE515F
MKVRYLWLGIWWFLIPVAHGQSNDEILWMHPDFPPIFVASGPRMGEGVGDRISRQITAQMPNYRHEKEVANFKRIVETIGTGRQVCAMTLLKNPERAERVSFSKPYMLSPHNSVITFRRLLPKFKPYMDKHGAVSLVALMQQKDLKLGYSLGRSYGKQLDGVVAKHAHTRNSSQTSGSDIFKGLMRMLQYGRVSHTIGYAYEAQYMATKLGFAEPIITLPIQESPDYTKVYVGCPKTPWGATVLKKVNRIIDADRQKPSLYKVYRSWLGPEAWQRYKLATEKFWRAEP